MGEIIFLKLLLTIASVAIVLTENTEDIKTKEECKVLLRIKEIERWLTYTNVEEVAVNAKILIHPEYDTKPPPVDGCTFDDMSNYKALDPGEGDMKFNSKEGPRYEWKVNVTHQASRLLKENKDILSTHNKTALRLLQLYSVDGAIFHFEPEKRIELKKVTDDLQTTFFETIQSESKTCGKRPRDYTLDLKPQDCSVLRCIWESWHNEIGIVSRNRFEKVVELMNEAAKLNGYNDVGEVWKISNVEDSNAEKEMERLLDGVMPLYEQLHAYVRRKVFMYYSNDSSCIYQPESEEPIPAHLTGNLIGQEWSELENLVLPYPDATLLNFTELMNSLKLDQNQMARKAEKFFTSLGFRPMTAEFWQKSAFTDIGDTEFGCADRVYDNYDGDGYRMFTCVNLTLGGFKKILWSMGYLAAHMESEHLPFKFNHGANKIIIDGMAHCVMIQDHLEKIFNLPKGDRNDKLDAEDVKKRDINDLMRSALFLLPQLPFSFVIEMWRYKVFRGDIPPEEYNKNWWKMRARYQGIVPPSPRTNSNFDPGAIVHVALNAPYGNNFFSLIVAFQMHETLCKLSNHVGPLHHCNIYQSAVAGEKLREILRQGASKPTVELLKELTGYEGYKYEPLLEYYKPLFDWLKEQNEGHTVGWNKNFSME